MPTKASGTSRRAVASVIMLSGLLSTYRMKTPQVIQNDSTNIRIPPRTISADTTLDNQRNAAVSSAWLIPLLNVLGVPVRGASGTPARINQVQTFVVKQPMLEPVTISTFIFLEQRTDLICELRSTGFIPLTFPAFSGRFNQTQTLFLRQSIS